jgi:hypothetical protein
MPWDVKDRLSGMLVNERRARTGSLNQIDGRCTGETASHVTNDFPYRNKRKH